MRTARRWFLASLLSVIAPAAATADDLPGQTAPIEQGALHYETIGHGDRAPLVLLNGGPGFDHAYLHDSWVWDTLAGQRRVIFLDQRGTGRTTSTIPTDRITVNLMVADIEALRRKLNVPRIVLLGHSFGGFLAMAYATQHPEHLAGLIMMDSGAPKLAATEYLFDRLYPDILQTQLPEQDDTPAGKMGCKANTLSTYYKMNFYDQRNARGLPDSAPHFSEATCTAVMLDAIGVDLTQGLTKVEVPTLVINGRFDANVAPTVADRISKDIKGSQLVFFEHSGHMPFLEEPDRLALVLSQFLDDVDGAGMQANRR